MAEYIYHCRQCGNETDVSEPMLAISTIYCDACGAVMRRRPLKVRVNWGGLRPSQGFIHPAIRQFVNDAPRRREEEAT